LLANERPKKPPSDGQDSSESRLIVGSVVTPEEMWACTNCRACSEKCPVFVEHVDHITDLRRYSVMVQGSMPVELSTTLQNLETQGDPWGIGPHEKSSSVEEMKLPKISDNPNPEILFYVGCAGLLNDRSKPVTVAFSNILRAAGVRFAVLGGEEPCCGDTARRAGNEYLYQNMANRNIEVLRQHGIETIVCTCPHCFHTIKREYSQLGFRANVLHHTEYIDMLLGTGRLKVNKSRGDVTCSLHDSCMLARYNGIYNEPRRIFDRIGRRIVEVEENRRNTFCCGAGGARNWIEEDEHQRVNQMRVKQLLAAKSDEIALACPYCMNMITDGLADLNVEKQVQDIAEIVSKLV
jgi:Fe-S oxidoreductase